MWKWVRKYRRPCIQQIADNSPTKDPDEDGDWIQWGLYSPARPPSFSFPHFASFRASWDPHRHATENIIFFLSSPLSCVYLTQAVTLLFLSCLPPVLPVPCSRFPPPAFRLSSLLPNLACQRNYERQEDGSCVLHKRIIYNN